MSYTKKMTTRVIRTKHVIDFREGGDHMATRAQDLMDMLKHVPPNARIDEVLCDDEGGTNKCTIEFHEEVAEPAA